MDEPFLVTARLVAELDGLAVPPSPDEVNARLRRISLARHVALQRCEQLSADVQRVKDELHRLRNEDAGKLGASELAVLRLRQGIDAALVVYHADELPCEEVCNRMAAELRQALAVVDAERL